MNELDLRASIAPKSDQLNADDLAGPGVLKVLTVTAVKRGPSDEQPVAVHYEGDDGRPYLPCKSMRRVLIHCWGDQPGAWIGRAMEVYNDPNVKYGGVAVGGIRIRALSHIEGAQHLSLTVTRSKRAPYKIEPLKVPEKAPYPADRFNENLPAWVAAVKAGKLTPEQVITRAEKTGPLTEDQRAQVRAAAQPEEPAKENAA